MRTRFIRTLVVALAAASLVATSSEVYELRGATGRQDLTLTPDAPKARVAFEARRTRGPAPEWFQVALGGTARNDGPDAAQLLVWVESAPAPGTEPAPDEDLGPAPYPRWTLVELAPGEFWRFDVLSGARDPLARAGFELLAGTGPVLVRWELESAITLTEAPAADDALELVPAAAN